MSKQPDRRAAAIAYIQSLGNPYAKLQLDGFDDEGRDINSHLANGELELRTPTVAERDYARRQGNQYTLLSVAIGEHGSVVAAKSVSVGKPNRRHAAGVGMSKKDFVSGCQRILRQYVPAVEKGRLRRHHRDFIIRNQIRGPSERQLLLKELSKYDLSSVAGIEARFNRERLDLTEQKLKQIEQSVLRSR